MNIHATWTTVLRLSLQLVLASLVAACASVPDRTHVTADFRDYAQRVNAKQVFAVWGTELKHASLRLAGEAGCKQALDPYIFSNVHQVVFAATDGTDAKVYTDRAAPESHSVWVVDLDNDRWNRLCEMVWVERKKFLDCEIADASNLALVLIYLDHYSDPLSYGDAYQAALNMPMRGGTAADVRAPDCL